MQTHTLRHVVVVLVLAVLVSTATVVWWFTAEHAPRTQLEADLRSAEAQLSANATDTVAVERLGVVYMRAGRYEDALSLWDSALEGSPDDPIYLFHRGETLIALNRDDEAIESLKKATESARNLETAFYALAKLYEERGDWDEVVINAGQAVEIEPSDADARFLYATALGKTGETDEARAQFEIVRSMVPEYPGLEEALDAL